MARDLVPIGARYGTKKPLKNGDIITGKTLSQHSFIPIVEQKATNKRFYHVGSGIENADTNVGRFSADVQVTPDSGTTINAGKGIGRFAVYPDDPEISEPKATGDEFSLAELRDLSALNTRDKSLLPVMKPGASKDEYVVFEVKIDSSQNATDTHGDSTISGSLSEVKVNR